MRQLVAWLVVALLLLLGVGLAPPLALAAPAPVPTPAPGRLPVPVPTLPSLPVRPIPIATPGIDITKTGQGTGTVAGPTGLYCGASCSAGLAAGTYTLYAYPDLATTYFAGWGGAAASCGRNRQCTVTVGTSRLAVTAKFEHGPHLSVVVKGWVGSSFVSFTPANGYACTGGQGSQCTFTYAPGDQVTLKTATTSNNYARAPNFVGWSGVSGCGTGDSCVVTFGSTDVTVTATFTIPVRLTLQGTGTGSASSSPAGVSCSGSAQCGSANVTPGQPVTLTATPASGSAVDHWGATVGNAADAAAVAACGSATTCTITPTSYVQVDLVWKATAGYALTVAKSGAGTGSVYGPTGLYCGTACSLILAPGTYTLYVNPELTTTYFAGWGGDAPATCGRNRSCAITVGTRPLSITARFERGPRLSVAVEGWVGSSFVSFTPTNGYACTGGQGSQCTFTYAPGDQVTLKTATTSNNYARAPNFVGWSGVSGCGTGDTCVVTFGATDVTVKATFTFPVAVTLRGTGTGSVTSSPAGVSCTSGAVTCGSVKVPPGQAVTLTATPSASSAVDRWGATVGNATDAAAVVACGAAATCTLTPTGYVQVDLYFKPK